MKSWISDGYIQEYELGNLYEKHCLTDPFKHVVLENFFSDRALAVIQETCRNAVLEPSHKKGIAEKANWYWGAFSNTEFLRFFYGKEFRQFLNMLFREELMPKTSQIPQLNVFMPHSKGIPIHNDLNENIGAATIIQLSCNNNNGTGGDLVFYKKNEEENTFYECKKIKPKLNTFILFKVGKNSYHSVSDMSGDWKRESVTIDWHIRETLLENV